MSYSQDLLNDLKKMGQKLRYNVIKSVDVGNAGHIGGSFSSADIVTALYFYKMKHDPKNLNGG